ncbi:hypothetical protein DL769_007026 [Monosporascus sp. CRB-8-3]|nr:hypothetical protein DL769_007026 [Monosporascus sp. CRB-8-3]
MSAPICHYSNPLKVNPTVKNIANEESLRQYFGENVTGSRSSLPLSSLKPDPKCRLISSSPQPYEGHALAYLDLPPGLFMLPALHHILWFEDWRNLFEEEEPRPSITEAPEQDTPVIPYKRWIRPQASIHHQFDPEKGTMLWIITAPVTPPGRLPFSAGGSKSKIWTEEFKVHMNKQHHDGKFLTSWSCFSISLDIHLKLAAWSIGDFSYCMQSLDDKFRQLTDKYIQVESKHVFEMDLQRLYSLIDDTEELQRCLGCNLTVLESLEKFYKTQFLNEMDDLDCIDWKEQCREELMRFCYELRQFILEVEDIQSRATVLASMAKHRQSVISKSLQNQTNRRMYELTEQGLQEAVNMSLLQKIAFIYLPISIISTIFGTDIVRFQSDLEPNQTYSWSHIAFLAWLIATGVFTTLTWTLSQLWKISEERKLRKLEDKMEYKQTQDTGDDTQPVESHRGLFSLWRKAYPRTGLSGCRPAAFPDLLRRRISLTAAAPVSGSGSGGPGGSLRRPSSASLALRNLHRCSATSCFWASRSARCHLRHLRPAAPLSMSTHAARSGSFSTLLRLILETVKATRYTGKYAMCA